MFVYLLALVQAYLLVVLLAIAVWGHARVLLEILAKKTSRLSRLSLSKKDEDFPLKP